VVRSNPAVLDGQKDQRFVVGEPVSDERLGKLVVRGLLVELAVAVEQTGHSA
jgi:hypothetical protein